MSDRKCSHMDNCGMYALFNYSATLQVWKINYCTADYERCERYKRSLEGRPVPQNLMPNGVLLQKT
ncbi:MAG: hypothetical protein AB2A00_13410 [Myxococcota bacterium]